MRRIFRLFKNCFGRCELESEDEDETPIFKREPRTGGLCTKRPPRFPKEPQQEIPTTLRPRSPFDKRLKLLGEKIEAEVQKDCAPSQKSQLAETMPREFPSIWASSALLNSADSLTSAVSFNDQAYVRKAVEFPSLEILEADCYRTLIEEQTIAAMPVCFRTPSYTSSNASLSPRDCSHQYLFYEDEEDVVMEFLPCLQAIPAC